MSKLTENGEVAQAFARTSQVCAQSACATEQIPDHINTIRTQTRQSKLILNTMCGSRSYGKSVITVSSRHMGRSTMICMVALLPFEEARTQHAIGHVDAIFGELARSVCPSPAARLYGIAANPAQIQDYARYARALPPSSTICEIGFNCGHSTATLLEANPTVHLVNFDLSTKLYPWSAAAKLWFRRRYGERLTLVEGDSTKTVPSFFASHPSVRCDLAIVDGKHDYVHPMLDIVLVAQGCKCGATLVADDLCNASACTAHDDRGFNQGAVIGPTQAWHEAQAKGYIVQSETRFAQASDRGWATASVVCVDGLPKPALTRYSPEPIAIAFEPHRPTVDKADEKRDLAQRRAAQQMWGARSGRVYKQPDRHSAT
jgi:hypothetical protein